MAVPKRRQSRSRRDKRRANWKASLPDIVECERCGEWKRPHHVCQACGFYRGERVLTVGEE